MIYYLAHPYASNPDTSIKLAFEVCFDLEFRRELIVYSPIRETHFFHLNLLKLGLTPIDYLKRDLALIEGMMKGDGFRQYKCEKCGGIRDYQFECCGKIKTTDYYDSGITVLLSKTAYSDAGEPRFWHSSGCRQEYEFAKTHHIRILELESFLQGTEREL